MLSFLSLNGLDASQMGISKTNRTQNIERKVISRSNLINLTTKYTNIDSVKKQNTKLYHAQSKKKIVVSTEKQEIQFLIYINQIVTFSYFFLSRLHSSRKGNDLYSIAFYRMVTLCFIAQEFNIK